MSRLPAGADKGPDPVIAAPVDSLIPTVDVAPAKGWAPGEAPGWKVEALASGLKHPR